MSVSCRHFKSSSGISTATVSLLRDFAGNMAIWLMDGTIITSNTSMVNVSDRQAQ